MNASTSRSVQLLLAKGSKQPAQRGPESYAVVDMETALYYLDKSFSVSALTSPSPHWDDANLEDMYHRFLNGS